MSRPKIGIHDRARRLGREGHAVLPEQDGLPGGGHRAGHGEGDEDAQGDEAHPGDRCEVRHVLHPERDRLRLLGRVAASRAATLGILLGCLVQPLEQRPEGATGPRRVRRRHEPTGQPEIAEQDDERADAGNQEQGDLGAQSRPEHAVEADALVPQHVCPQVEPDREDADEQERDDADDDPADPGPTTAAIVVDHESRSPRRGGLTRRRGSARLRVPVAGLGVGVVGGVVTVVGRIVTPVGVRADGAGTLRGTGVGVLATCGGLPASKLLEKVVEQVAHQSEESSRSGPEGPRAMPEAGTADRRRRRGRQPVRGATGPPRHGGTRPARSRRARSAASSRREPARIGRRPSPRVGSATGALDRPAGRVHRPATGDARRPPGSVRSGHQPATAPGGPAADPAAGRRQVPRRGTR